MFYTAILVCALCSLNAVMGESKDVCKAFFNSGEISIADLLTSRPVIFSKVIPLVL